MRSYNPFYHILILLCIFLSCGCNRQEKPVTAGQSHIAENLLLITADTLRSDHLGCYGYNKNTSPNIDRLASEGVHFLNVSSVINNTNPSHLSIFTALYPKNHGTYTNWTPMSSSHVTLAQILKDAGYKTAAFVSTNHMNGGNIGLAKGFDYYPNVNKSKAPAEETIKKALQWLGKNAHDPFFLWVHLYDPHLPYTPPAPYNRVFSKQYTGWGKTLFDILNGKTSARNINLSQLKTSAQQNTIKKIIEGRLEHTDVLFNKVALNKEDIAYVISQYDGEIKYMDYYVGFLRESIQKMNLPRNTVIIFTADHGESLGEHNIYFDHQGIYEPSLRVPLIIHRSGFPARKVTEFVSNIDILPTVLDILNVPVRSNIRNKFDGKSLLRLMQGYRENIRNTLYIGYARNLAKAIKKNNVKYICPIKEDSKDVERFEHGEELYDLINDPLEQNNLLSGRNKDNEIYQELKQDLLNWAGNTWTVQNDQPSQDRLYPGLKENLKALGYIN